MKATSKQLLLCLRDDSQNVSDFIGKNPDFLENENKSLSVIVLRNIFFFHNKSFSNIDLETQTKKFMWIKNMLQSFYNTLIAEEDDKSTYENLNQLFSIHYNKIKENFGEFINSLVQKKIKVKYDLFSVLITFLSYLNGNSKYINTLYNITKNAEIEKLKLFYEEKNNKLLLNVITDYCKLRKIPILYSNDKIANVGLFNIDLDELKCFTEVCSMNESYKKLVQTLFCCFKNSKDLRDDRPEKIRNFIEDIFAIFNICLRKIEFGDESGLLDIYGAIYNKSFEYSSKDYNETYIDFVIHYITKYKLSAEDFFHFFLNGLLEGKFITTFINLNLKEFNDNINEKKTIQLLIAKMTKRKKKNKTKKKAVVDSNYINISDKKEEVKLSEISIIKKEEEKSQTKDEKKDNIIIETEQKLGDNLTENIGEYLTKKNSEKNENEKNEIQKTTPKNESKPLNEEMSLKLEKLENEIILLKEQNKELVTQVNDLTKKNEDLTGQFKDLYEEYSFLIDDNSKKDIQIKKLYQDINEINKKLEIISFRDLSKKILDNMLQFVQERDKNIFQGISKRKKKIEILNKNYEYKNIEFMRKPISEIAEKYYYSNILSHVPKIVSIINGKPFGMLKDLIGDVSKRFYKIIIDSKSDDVFNFIQDKLNIKKEIDTLYK